MKVRSNQGMFACFFYLQIGSKLFHPKVILNICIAFTIFHVNFVAMICKDCNICNINDKKPPECVKVTL